MARKCYVQSVKVLETHKGAGDRRREEDVEVKCKRRKECEGNAAEYEAGELLSIMIDPEYPEKQVRIGQQMHSETREAMGRVLKENRDMFA